VSRRTTRHHVNTDFDAIVPMLCVLLAGAGRAAGPRRSAAAASGCRSAARARRAGRRRRLDGAALGPQRRAFGVIVADNFGLFVTLVS
jgi:hypothetical protein